MTDTFPRQQARTRHFSLGVPRSFQISADGARLAFLRSKGGSDPVTCLWVLDLPTDPSASADVIDDLWSAAGRAVKRRREVRPDPVWISTADLGVHWLHVRLDT